MADKKNTPRALRPEEFDNDLPPLRSNVDEGYPPDFIERKNKRIEELKRAQKNWPKKD